jgi:ABC-type uncharacterized transport system permease subunit
MARTCHKFSAELANKFRLPLSSQPHSVLVTRCAGYRAVCIYYRDVLFLMPLRFFPEGVQTIAYLTPFPHMLNTVVEVYLGVLTGMNLVWALLAQAAWVIGLVVICQFVLSRATRRLVILGG